MDLPNNYLLHVIVIEGKDLKRATYGLRHVYAELRFKGRKLETGKSAEGEARWNQHFDFDIHDFSGSLVVKIYGKQAKFRQRYLGECRIKIDNLRYDFDFGPKWFKLMEMRSSSRKSVGKLKLHLKLMFDKKSIEAKKRSEELKKQQQSSSSDSPEMESISWQHMVTAPQSGDFLEESDDQQPANPSQSTKAPLNRTLTYDIGKITLGEMISTQQCARSLGPCGCIIEDSDNGRQTHVKEEEKYENQRYCLKWRPDVITPPFSDRTFKKERIVFPLPHNWEWETDFLTQTVSRWKIDKNWGDPGNKNGFRYGTYFSTLRKRKGRRKIKAVRSRKWVRRRVYHGAVTKTCNATAPRFADAVKQGNLIIIGKSSDQEFKHFFILNSEYLYWYDRDPFRHCLSRLDSILDHICLNETSKIRKRDIQKGVTSGARWGIEIFKKNGEVVLLIASTQLEREQWISALTDPKLFRRKSEIQQIQAQELHVKLSIELHRDKWKKKVQQQTKRKKTRIFQKRKQESEERRVQREQSPFMRARSVEAHQMIDTKYIRHDYGGEYNSLPAYLVCDTISESQGSSSDEEAESGDGGTIEKLEHCRQCDICAIQ